MTAIILAGGKASRMRGRDKAFLKIGNEPIIKRQLKVLKGIFKKIIIVTNTPHKYRLRTAKIIKDLIPNLGPLGGIYSGLSASHSFYNLVIACDTPFINSLLVRYMMEKRDDYDIIIPRIDERFHPLFGIYSKRCLPIIREMLKKDRRKVSSIFRKLKTHLISKSEIKIFDENLLSLVNINTRRDLLRAKKLQETFQ